MPEEYESTICIEDDHGILEECPATFLIFDGGHGGATLAAFTIGRWTGSRADAVLMTGEDHVARQEGTILEQWVQIDHAEQAACDAADAAWHEREDAA